MAGLTNQEQPFVKIYDILTNVAEKKLIAISEKLDIDKFVFEKKNHYEITFFDTVDNLLTNTGVLLYKTEENGEYFFKIEKLNFLPNLVKLRKTEIFERKITAKDTPKSQAFYLISGITSLFSTQFNVDLENVVRVAVPKLSVEIQGTQYKGFKGNGFKCSVEFQKVKYTNLETRKKRENDELTIKNNSSKQFEKDFGIFIESFEKYFKDALPKTQTRYDFGNKITTPIAKKIIKAKKSEAKKKKTIRIEDKIED